MAGFANSQELFPGLTDNGAPCQLQCGGLGVFFPSFGGVENGLAKLRIVSALFRMTLTMLKFPTLGHCLDIGPLY